MYAVLQSEMSPKQAVLMWKKNDSTDPLLAHFLVRETQHLHVAKTSSMQLLLKVSYSLEQLFALPGLWGF